MHAKEEVRMKIECNRCGGIGKRTVGEKKVGGMMKPRYEPCRECDGTGEKEVSDPGRRT